MLRRVKWLPRSDRLQPPYLGYFDEEPRMSATSMLSVLLADPLPITREAMDLRLATVRLAGVRLVWS